MALVQYCDTVYYTVSQRKCANFGRL